MPETSRTPRNLAGTVFHEIDGIEIAEYHPLPDGMGHPTQVHMSLNVAGMDHPLVVRFKSRTTITEIIEALILHRDGVWPA